MMQPIIQINFGKYGDTQKEIREVWVKTINEAVLSAQDNEAELQAWEEFFREGKFLCGHLRDKLKYGAAPTADEKRKGVA